MFVLKITLVSLLTLSSRKNETQFCTTSKQILTHFESKVEKMLELLPPLLSVSADEKMAHRQQHNAPGKLERFILVVVVLPWLILEHSRTFTCVKRKSLDLRPLHIDVMMRQTWG